jgi:hypothetical protein
VLIRSVALAFVIGLMTTTGASVATAGAVPVPCLGIRSDGSVGAQCETAAQGPAEESSESTTLAGAAAGPTEPMVSVPTLTTGADGGDCLGFEDRPATDFATGATTAEENVEWMLLYASQWLDPCAGAAVPALTPAMWTYSWLRSVDLPVPEPQLGVMWVVGIPPPLHIGSEVTTGFSEASPFGPATMSVTSEVWIDWGDGEGFTGPFATAGSRDVDAEPFPHVWQHDGFYDVTVQQRWTAEWSVGGGRGTLDGLTTEGTREAFEVISIEAVGAG